MAPFALKFCGFIIAHPGFVDVLNYLDTTFLKYSPSLISVSPKAALRREPGCGSFIWGVVNGIWGRAWNQECLPYYPRKAVLGRRLGGNMKAVVDIWDPQRQFVRPWPQGVLLTDENKKMERTKTKQNKNPKQMFEREVLFKCKTEYWNEELMSLEK